jgi:hypothetical protein
MAKESLYAPQKAPILRDTMTSDQDTRLIGGVPTLYTYTDGVATAPATGTGHITYRTTPIAATMSIRMIVSNLQQTDTRMLSFANPVGNQWTLSGTNGNNTIQSTSGTRYINGVATSTAVSGENEIVVTGIAITGAVDRIILGNVLALNYGMPNIKIELFEIYNYTLTAQEVANLYNNARYEGIQYASGVTEILNVDGTNGVIENKWNSTITNTNVTVARDGNVYAMESSVLSSNLNCGSYDTLLGNKTLIIWIKPWFTTSSGPGSINIVTNGQFILQIDRGGSNRFFFSRSNFVSPFVSGGNIQNMTWQQIVVTSTSTGVSLMYQNGILIGTGTVQTPVAGGNILLGNGQTVGKARFAKVRIIDGILSAQEVSQLFSSERGTFNV